MLVLEACSLSRSARRAWPTISSAVRKRPDSSSSLTIFSCSGVRRIFIAFRTIRVRFYHCFLGERVPSRDVFPDDGGQAAARRGRNELGIGDDGVPQRFAAFALAFGGHLADRIADHVAGAFGVAVQIADDLLERDGAVLGMPAVVVRDHGYGCVAKLGLAS